MAGRDATQVVLVPLKSFTTAKSRLSACCSPAERAGLSRWMATRVISASTPTRCVVVCDDEEVAAFAADHDAGIHWTPGLDLNDALSTAVRAMADIGVDRVVVAAGDLPFAHDLGRLEVLDGSPPQHGEVLVVGDRHGEGTNVLSFATAFPVTPSYGPGSLQRHLAQARARGLAVREIRDEALAWDIDTPADLAPPAHLGMLSLLHRPIEAVVPAGPAGPADHATSSGDRA